MPTPKLPLLHSLYKIRLNKPCWQKGRLALLLCLCCMHPMRSLASADLEASAMQAQQMQAQHKSAIVWPLLPGESLQTLADKRYPQSPILQQRFIQQTLSLSRHRGIHLQASEKADYARLIIVPDAETLHTLTHPIKKAKAQTTATAQRLALSLELSHAKHENPTSPARLRQWLSSDPTATDASELHHHGGNRIKTWASSLSCNTLASGQHLSNTAWQTLRNSATQLHDNYTRNTALIARIPLRQLHQHPQQAVITLSTILLVLSIVWGMVECRSAKEVS